MCDSCWVLGLVCGLVCGALWLRVCCAFRCLDVILVGYGDGVLLFITYDIVRLEF